MSLALPPRMVIRAIATVGGLLGLAAVGLAADRRGAPAQASPVASAPGVALVASSSPELVVALPVASAAASSSGAPQAPAPGGTLPDGRVVLNLATEDDLRKLPGIGASRAQAILALRQRQGGKFRAVSDLLRVKGIGRKMMARLAPKLVLDPPRA